MSTKREDLKRISHIVGTLFKEGLGYFVQQLELKWHLPLISKLFLKDEKVPQDIPVRLRTSFEKLGGAYLKLGQFLSLRPDLIPEEYCTEFKKLLDEVSPLDYSIVEELIEKALKKPIKEVFKSIDKKPLGSASIAQVHRAKLVTGHDVVIKIQRPDIAKKIEEDVDILYYLAHKIEHSKRFKDLDPVAIVSEFENYTKKELNFIFEAKNIDKFYNAFKKSKKILIPKVHWLLTTDNLLVMDYMDGIKLSEIIKKPEVHKKINPKELSRVIGNLAVTQIFDLGFFHADLHPGNILILDNKIVLIDFGIVGAISEELREKEINLYTALLQKDIDKFISLLKKVGTISSETDLEGFEKESVEVLNKWYSEEKRIQRPTEMMYKLYTVCNKYKLLIPKELFILGKAILTVEACCWTLNPEFDFMKYSEPKIINFLKKQRKPEIMIRSFLKKSKDFSRNIYDLPPSMLDVLDRLKTGRFIMDMHETDVKHLGYDVELSSNRLSFAIVMASFIIAGSLLVDFGPKYAGYSVVSIFSFAISMLLFGILTTSIFKEGSIRFDPHRKI